MIWCWGRVESGRVKVIHRSTDSRSKGGQMHTGLGSALALLSVLCDGSPDSATAPAPNNYVVFAIKTDLQRRLLGSSQADAYLLFDVDDGLRDDKFDVQRVDKDGIQKELAALVKQNRLTQPNLHLCFRYRGLSLNGSETKRVESAVTTACPKPDSSKARSADSVKACPGATGSRCSRA